MVQFPWATYICQATTVARQPVTVARNYSQQQLWAPQEAIFALLEPLWAGGQPLGVATRTRQKGRSSRWIVAR